LVDCFRTATAAYSKGAPFYTAFNTTARIRDGFCLDSKGDVWAGLDKTNAIWHYPLTGFDANGQPMWGAGISTPIPSTIKPLTRIIYVPDTDTMILAQGIVGSTDWTSVGTRIEVYHGWLAGNTTTPNPVITLSSANPKSIAAAGNYLFVGYVHTVPNIDAFNLTTGALDTTLINSSPDTVYVGNDVDLMYGIRAYLKSTGEYMVTKDNYNGSSVVIYRWTPGAANTAQTISFPAIPNTVYAAAPIALQATAGSNLPVTYTVTGPAALAGQSLTITGAGTVTVTANQSGDNHYAAGPPVVQTFTVVPAVLTVATESKHGIRSDPPDTPIQHCRLRQRRLGKCCDGSGCADHSGHEHLTRGRLHHHRREGNAGGSQLQPRLR